MFDLLFKKKIAGTLAKLERSTYVNTFFWEKKLLFFGPHDEDRG